MRRGGDGMLRTENGEKNKRELQGRSRFGNV